MQKHSKKIQSTQKTKKEAGKNLYSCKLNLHSFTRFIFSLFYFFFLIFLFWFFMLLPYELEFLLQIQCYSSCFFDGFIHCESVENKRERERERTAKKRKGARDEKALKITSSSWNYLNIKIHCCSQVV